MGGSGLSAASPFPTRRPRALSSVCGRRGEHRRGLCGAFCRRRGLRDGPGGCGVSTWPLCVSGAHSDLAEVSGRWACGAPPGGRTGQ